MFFDSYVCAIMHCCEQNTHTHIHTYTHTHTHTHTHTQHTHHTHISQARCVTVGGELLTCCGIVLNIAVHATLALSHIIYGKSEYLTFFHAPLHTHSNVTHITHITHITHTHTHTRHTSYIIHHTSYIIQHTSYCITSISSFIHTHTHTHTNAHTHKHKHTHTHTTHLSPNIPTKLCMARGVCV